MVASHQCAENIIAYVHGLAAAAAALVDQVVHAFEDIQAAKVPLFAAWMSSNRRRLHSDKFQIIRTVSRVQISKN